MNSVSFIPQIPQTEPEAGTTAYGITHPEQTIKIFCSAGFKHVGQKDQRPALVPRTKAIRKIDATSPNDRLLRPKTKLLQPLQHGWRGRSAAGRVPKQEQLLLLLYDWSSTQGAAAHRLNSPRPARCAAAALTDRAAHCGAAQVPQVLQARQHCPDPA